MNPFPMGTGVKVWVVDRTYRHAVRLSFASPSVQEVFEDDPWAVICSAFGAAEVIW
ncbi:hypothetical protein [Rhizobium beringeri]|uniref:hypothetical protein n=1 Tax=Rhizobium beringeri TaxID=3019934 RepID=UPI003B5C028D